MRAARLLHCLLLLQNRGRMTSVQLARELEVSPRTILRDLDAMTEAGLPIIVHQGNQGGIELGFDYRTRLTGLTHDEADALAVIVNLPLHELQPLGLTSAGRLALSKIRENLPDLIRDRIARTETLFSVPEPDHTTMMDLSDPRIPAMADAIRNRQIVRLQAKSGNPHTVHPIHLTISATDCAITDDRAPDQPCPLAQWGDINISAKTF